MMNLRRIKKLAGLSETITDDSQLNSRIEHTLKSAGADTPAGILDALEILYNSPEPISARTWADQVKALHPDQDPAVILTQTRRLFPWLAERTTNNLYQWHVVNELDPTYNAIHNQITLTNVAQDTMKRLGTFTAEKLAIQVSQQLGVPQHSIMGWIEHLLSNFPSKITKIGNQYTYADSTGTNRDSNMDMLRRLAGNQ
jgi:hypothetical protein